MTITELGTMVTTFFDMVGDGVGIMMKPPIVWFVALGFAGAVLGTAKTLVPRKKAK